MRCENKTFLQNDPGFLQEISSTAVEVGLAAEPQLRSDISVCSFVLTFHRKLWSRYTRCPALATESLSTAAPQFVRKNELVAVTAGYASSENLLGLLAGSAMRTRLRRWRRWTRSAIQCPSSLALAASLHRAGDWLRSSRMPRSYDRAP